MTTAEEERRAGDGDVSCQLENLDATFVNGLDHASVAIRRCVFVKVILMRNPQQTLNTCARQSG